MPGLHEAREACPHTPTHPPRPQLWHFISKPPCSAFVLAPVLGKVGQTAWLVEGLVGLGTGAPCIYISDGVGSLAASVSFHS